MFRTSALGTLSCMAMFALFAACSGGGEGGAAGGTPTGGGAIGNGGAMGASGTSATSIGGASGASANTGGASGYAGSDGGSSGSGVTDAAMMDASTDVATDRTTTSQCLGVNQACDVDGSTCCEAYVCRFGKCCTPTGIRSNCIANSDCCSNSCILNQCTCVPRGYTCTGPGQCCSGFSCENGTCICPPDIRGCN
jgi:hypothetical protein